MDTLISHNFCAFAQNVIDIEQKAVGELKNRLNNHFTRVCEMLAALNGHVIVMGMGKSGHIGRKIAATLASTGTPSFFVHPAEASHGDMGMITADDAVIMLSNSGKTAEMLQLIPFVKRLGIPIVSLTGNKHSPLASVSNFHLDVSINQEACPLDLAPTASTTVALVMGDAIALSLLKAKGFTSEDFARSHPGGALGKRLIKIMDIMQTGQHVPSVHEQATINEALVEMTQKGLGMTAVVSSNNTLMGVFTDGDLRRAVTSDINLKTTPVIQAMTPGGKTLNANQLAIDAVREMEENKVNGFFVLNEQRELVGALNMHDLLKAKVL